MDSSKLPDALDPGNQTLSQVEAFMKADRTRKMKYQKGYNCVDFSWTVMRQAEWQGLLSFAVAIYYEGSSGHMIVGFPTCDKGFVFYEPQNGERIYPRVGKMHDGWKVCSIYATRLAEEHIPLDDSPPHQPVSLPYLWNQGPASSESSIFSVGS